jgi:protein-tyrosine phosphatase
LFTGNLQIVSFSQFCSMAGVSRSSTVAIGYMMKHHNIGHKEALGRVWQVNPEREQQLIYF